MRHLFHNRPLVVLDWREELAPVLAAHGNGDSGSDGCPVVPEDPPLQEAQVVRYHGWTVPRNLQA
jgi:hypothetical protein